MSYQKILRGYKNTNEAELEFRFLIRNVGTFKKLISSVNGDRTLEQSINFIAQSTDHSRIQKMLFVNGSKRGSVYMSKKQIMKTPVIDGTLQHKVTVAQEKQIDPFDINLSKLARIKLRLSVRPKEIPEWRVDFTLTKTVNNIKNNIKRDKGFMLFNIDIENFVRDAPWDYADATEMEIEHVGKGKNLTQEDMDGVIDYIYGMAGVGHRNMFEYQNRVLEVASFLVDKNKLHQFKQKKGLRDLYNRVWELNKSSYFKIVFPKLKNYFLLDKADGIRSLVMIKGKSMDVISDEITSIKLKENHPSVTIFDAEYIKENNTYYVFDVLVFNGENLTNHVTEKRIQYIPKIIDMSEGNAKEKTIISLTSNYKKEIIGLFKSEKPYKTDGIIFTPKNSTYRKMKSWKWKPLNHMSIDFLVKLPPSGLIGVSPYLKKPNHTIMFLFSGISKQLYDKLRMLPVSGYSKIFPKQKMYNNFPIQFSPSDDPHAYIYYHPNDSKIDTKDIIGNVCEFKRVDLDTSPKWDLMRIRTDRNVDVERGNYFGNGFYVAEYTWLNYQNPLRVDDLVISSTEYMDMGYFHEEKSNIHKYATGFNSFVKNRLLSKFSKSKWLVDLAAGKGQDMFRVSDANISNALFVDRDSHALSELVSKKHDFQRGIKRLNTRIFTKMADLTTDYKDIIEGINQIGTPVGSVDVVMCNFAIHYLLGTPKNLRNLINLIKALLKPGGHFFFTAFDGSKVFDLLKNTDRWDARESGVLMYSIEKKYNSDALKSTGQSINVLLPFSGGRYYSEYLVNFKYVLDEFVKNGFSNEKCGNFSSFMPLFKTESPNIYNKLTKSDNVFTSLYGYGVVRKNNK